MSVECLLTTISSSMFFTFPDVKSKSDESPTCLVYNVKSEPLYEVKIKSL